MISHIQSNQNSVSARNDSSALKLISSMGKSQKSVAWLGFGGGVKWNNA